MAILQLGPPQGRIIPGAELHAEDGEERCFAPGILHGGDYLLHAEAYATDEGMRMAVRMLDRDHARNACKVAGYGTPDMDPQVFADCLAETETFVCANGPDDPCFAYLDEAWDKGFPAEPAAIAAWAGLDAEGRIA